MNLWESIQVSLEGLAANKMRSTLTMLGVIIGVAAFIAALALTAGARQQMMSRIQQMGTNVLIVMSGQSRRGAVMGGFGSVQSLTMQDADAIPRKCPTVLKSAPEVRNAAQVRYRDQNTSTTIVGVTPDYLGVRDYNVQRGKFFTDRDVKTLAKVAAIGATTAQNLFGDVSPVGKSIYIKGSRFKIIGLMTVKGAAGAFGDPDDQIFVPISTAMRRLFGLDYVRAISVESRSLNLMNQSITEIESALRKRHHLAANADDDFVIRNQAEFVDLANQSADTFKWLFGGIALFSLLAGGIGVMNIMLVSVTERTREIGIRKALGARRRDILLQFLVEAVVLSVVGGLIGILAGTLASFGFTDLIGTKPGLTFVSYALPFCSSVIVGVIFGLYPAWKAGRLDPIDALRYE